MTLSPSHERKSVTEASTLHHRTASDSKADDHPSSSPKRRSSEATTTPGTDHNNNNNNNGDSKKKRRKVNHACVYCRRSHMTCDLKRPCARCIKRDIGHLCHDEPREPPKRGKSMESGGASELALAPEDGAARTAELDHGGSLQYGGGSAIPDDGDDDDDDDDVDYEQIDSAGGAATGVGRGPTQIMQPTPVSPHQLQRKQPRTSMESDNNANSGSVFPSNFDWNNSGVHNQFQDMHHLHPNYMFNTSEAINEYNLLNDFLSNSLLDDGALYNTDDAQPLFNDPLLATSSVNALANILPQQALQSSTTTANHQQNQQQQQQQYLSQTTLPQSKSAIGEEISRPSSAFPLIDPRARDKFYLTAADPAGLSSAEDRLHKLLKAKYDAGMLKPFNYVKGYARLNTYISHNLSRESQLRILKQLERFRPKFREAMQSLTDMQLVLVEMWFERSLMEYDRVFASMAIPACCWRRTGEVFRGNREMAELIGVPMERLREGKLGLWEIMGEDSLVSYWEKFGAIAFDGSQKAILTSCSLKSPVVSAGVGARRVGGEAMERGKQSQKEEDGDDEDGLAHAAAAERQQRGKSRGRKEGQMMVRCCFSFTIRRDTHNM